MVATDVMVAIVGNVLSTTGIILANKYLFVSLGFKFMVALSSFHFFFTAAATRLLLAGGFFAYKPAHMRQVMPLVVGSVGSVGFMNLNLAHNSVGFYQLSKLLCIPVTLTLQYLMRGTTVSRNVKYCLAVVLAGVYVAQVSDVELNPTGTMFAAVAVVCTTMAQIFTNTIQSDLGLDHMQLLYHTSPLIGCGMALMCPIFDRVVDSGDGSPALLTYAWTAEAAATAIMTGICAVGVNVSNYMVIGRTSPLTYLVVGHLKTCLILVFGFVIFGYPIVPRNVAGICVAVVGMIMYSEVKSRESAAAKAAAAAGIPLKSVNGGGQYAPIGRSVLDDDEDLDLPDEDV